MPQFEIVSGYNYPNVYSLPPTALGSTIQQQEPKIGSLSVRQEASAESYKESNINMMANHNVMRYNELENSDELSLN